jgi:hypothetical protein
LQDSRRACARRGVADDGKDSTPLAVSECEPRRG